MTAAALSAQTPAPKPATPAATAAPAQAVKPAVTPASKPVPVTIPAPAAQLPATAVVFSVGGEKMTKAEFDRFVQLLPETVRKQFDGPNRRKVAEQLAELKALSQEAKRQGLDQKPEVQQQIKIQTENVLASQVYQQLVETGKKDPATVKAYYDTHKSEFEQAKARHILIRFQGSRVPLKANQKDLTEAEALEKVKALRARIVKGEDFVAVCKAESDDPGSGPNGGDLGEFGHGAMVPEFEKAAFSQPIGEVSEPVKTPFGWHLIQVQSRGEQPFEKVQAQIEQKLGPQAAEKGKEAIKKQANIVLDDTYFGKP